MGGQIASGLFSEGLTWLYKGPTDLDSGHSDFGRKLSRSCLSECPQVASPQDLDIPESSGWDLKLHILSGNIQKTHLCPSQRNPRLSVLLRKSLTAA